MRSFNWVMITFNSKTSINVTEMTKNLIHDCAVPCQAVQLLVLFTFIW